MILFGEARIPALRDSRWTRPGDFIAINLLRRAGSSSLGLCSLGHRCGSVISTLLPPAQTSVTHLDDITAAELDREQIKPAARRGHPGLSLGRLGRRAAQGIKSWVTPRVMSRRAVPVT